MSEQIKKGSLRDGGNFIVHKNVMKIKLKKNETATIVSELELVKVKNNVEKEDFWAVIEKPSTGDRANYENFKASIEEKNNGDSVSRELKPDRRPTPYNPNIFEHYIGFGRCIQENENITLTYSYDRPIKEIVTEKGFLFRNRVVLYVNSFSIPCETLTVEIIPARRFFKSELRKNYHCENIHANERVFYAEQFVKHREYVIQQFLSWRILPPRFERITWKLFAIFGTAILGMLISMLFHDTIKAFIDNISKIF